jgi:hypothetical protein
VRLQAAMMAPEDKAKKLDVEHNVVEPNLIATVPLGRIPFVPVTVTVKVSTRSDP